MSFKFRSMLVLTLVAFVAIGCGKDKKKSNSPYPYGYPGQFVNNFTGQPQQNVAALNSWATAVEDKTVSGVDSNGNVMVAHTYYAGLDCTKLFGIFPFCAYKDKAPSTQYSTIQVPSQAIRANYPNIQTILYGGTITSVTQQDNLIEVIQGSGTTMKRYIIDTNIHAALNPRQYENVNNGTVKILSSH